MLTHETVTEPQHPPYDNRYNGARCYSSCVTITKRKEPQSVFTERMASEISKQIENAGAIGVKSPIKTLSPALLLRV